MPTTLRRYNGIDLSQSVAVPTETVIIPSTTCSTELNELSGTTQVISLATNVTWNTSTYTIKDYLSDCGKLIPSYLFYEQEFEPKYVDLIDLL